MGASPERVPRPGARTGRRIGAPEPIAALNRVTIREYAVPHDRREPLVDIRVACPDVVVLPHACPYLRETVAGMVNAAQSALPNGYRLQVSTALRTLAMQSANWNGYYGQMRAENPTWPTSALRRATNKFHAPYDQKAPPGHCTGGAVDVLLLDAAGELLDLTSPLAFWDGAYTWTDKISLEAKANRMILVEAMLSAGFSNCRDEYWHYSWGDSAWAVRRGETNCPYGWAHAPVAVETDFVGAIGRVLNVETVRDVIGKPFAANVELEPESNDGEPVFAVGVYWASGAHVRITVPSVTSRTMVSANRTDWTCAPTSTANDDKIEICLTPDADRIYLATENALPPPPEEKPHNGGPPRVDALEA